VNYLLLSRIGGTACIASIGTCIVDECSIKSSRQPQRLKLIDTYVQEAERLLGAARKEGTGWVRVDSELISKIDSALDTIRVALVKADRENNSLYFQVHPIWPGPQLQAMTSGGVLRQLTECFCTCWDGPLSANCQSICMCAGKHWTECSMAISIVKQLKERIAGKKVRSFRVCPYTEGAPYRGCGISCTCIAGVPDCTSRGY
jgi:hypothetical protein